MDQLRTLFFVSLVALASCGGSQQKTRGPIVLGDPNTIVTEQDTAFLSDFVDDINIRTRDTLPVMPVDTALPADTTAVGTNAPLQEQAAPATDPGDGLHVNFKEVQVFLPGVETRELKKQDPSRSNGVSYQLTDGNIRTNKLVMTGATIQRVLQKYITTVVAQNELGTLNLESLGSTSGWKPLPGRNNSYTIAGLEQNKLQTRKISSAAIRAAVSKAARRKKLSRQATQKWEQSVRRVTSVSQKPLSIYLRTVIWKIEGKDARGKNFQKEIRLDMVL